MTPKTIEELIDDIVSCFEEGTSYNRGQLRTKLTTHTEEEVKKAREEAIKETEKHFQTGKKILDICAHCERKKHKSNCKLCGGTERMVMTAIGEII